MLGLNAGTHPNQEPDDFVWLIKNIQSVVDTPLCLDSANPKALSIAIQAVDKDPHDQLHQWRTWRLKNILPNCGRAWL